MSELTEQLETAKALLHLHFGHKDFRPGQKEIISDVFKGHNILTIMPTGGGKSLCYQLPALCLDGVALVISPLIALMKDQVDSLTTIGISSTFINSSLSLSETINRFNEIRKNFYKIIYIAPERFYNNDFLELVKDLKFSLLAIDEAHCISQWGHDFRPSYAKIKNFIPLLKNPQVIALTATATAEVRDDILKQLDLKDPKIHITGFNRPNLHYHIVKASDYQKLDYCLELVQQINGSGIIYASTREKVNAIAENLQSNGISAEAYHAGMETTERTSVQEQFMNGKVRVIVATNAFGMGIDKSDIRFVVHFDLPGTIEAYYQEAGRAGRDGLPSQCVLFYHPADRYIREFFINNENPSPQEVKQLYQVLISYDTETIRTTYSELKAQTFSGLSEMAIGAIIKILERYSLIERPKDKENDGYLKFLNKPSEVLSQISSRAKSQKTVAENLFNCFGESLCEGVKIQVDDFVINNDLTKSGFINALKSLQEKNLIEYDPPFRGTEIKILKNILPEKLGEVIDFTAIVDKKNSSLSKLNCMESYANHIGCRRQFILKYFNDENHGVVCEACDYCLGRYANL